MNRKVAVAPMMDCTDRHDRFFLRLISKNVMLYSEMVATKSAIHGDRKKILSFSAEEKPLALQVGGSDKNELAEVAIDLGAEDIINNDDDSVEIITAPNDFLNIKDGFDKIELKYEFAELTMKAETEIALKGSEGDKMRKILDSLEDLDDVHEVYTNVVIEDD